jgi:sulfite reductase beta subunit-like hemoprotein
VAFREGLRAEDVVPLANALLRLFNTHGDRRHRTRARLRHIRERLGDEVFVHRVEQAFERESVTYEGPRVHAVACGHEVAVVERLQLPCGDIAPELAIRLAEVADEAGAKIRLGLEHNILLFAGRELRLDDELSKLRDRPRIVACPGSKWCARGIADSRSAADGIREGLQGVGDLSISVNGCPNNCGHAPIADVGLIGCRKTVNGVKMECFRVVAGGGKGKTPELAQELHPGIPASKVTSAVGLLWRAFKSTGGERAFGEFVRACRSELVVRLREV